MTVEFDLYCLPLRRSPVGTVITLDAVDGFFDQYFDGIEPGVVIRFLVLAGGPRAMPETAAQLETLPFVEARVRRCGDIDGDVEILTRTSFGEWLRSLEVSDAVPPAQLQALAPDAPIANLISRALLEGDLYWTRGRRFWRTLADTSAVLLKADQAGARIVVIRTNGSSALVARVERETG